jgi:hypothetical protein
VLLWYSCIKPFHGHGLKTLEFITTLLIIIRIITRLVAVMATLTIQPSTQPRHNSASFVYYIFLHCVFWNLAWSLIYYIYICLLHIRYIYMHIYVLHLSFWLNKLHVFKQRILAPLGGPLHRGA